MGTQSTILDVKELISDLNNQCTALDQLIVRGPNMDINIQLKIVRHHLVASRLILNGVYAELLMDNKAWEISEEILKRRN